MNDWILGFLDFWIFGFWDFWDFWEKGFELETPKKYTFALVEEKWVFKYRVFSKIAVLFLWILFFVFFVDFETKYHRFLMIFG